MTKRKELPTISPSVHTFSITGRLKSNWVQKRIEHALHSAVEREQYKWLKRNFIAKKGGGLYVRLYSIRDGQTFVCLDNINLPRLSGENSYLALTDLSEEGLYRYQSVFEQELKLLGIPWESEDISWTLSRLDLTQDFYVKSDPSLMIRNLRFAGETGLFRGMSAEHFRSHNEKHSAKWKSRFYSVTLYDKHAEIKNRQKDFHNVPESDLVVSKNRLRYEVSLYR